VRRCSVAVGPLDDPAWEMLKDHHEHYRLKEPMHNHTPDEIGLLMVRTNRVNDDAPLVSLRFKGNMQEISVPADKVEKIGG
jgi:hypothetical protein